MIKRLFPMLLLAALALPGTAAAKALDVEGPVTIKGHGPLRGELTMANPSETRAVQLGGKVGFVRFVDLAGDLRVACRGRGRSRTGENGQGQKVVTCRGKGGRAKVHGSKFRIALLARTFGMKIPQGVAGTLHGRFEVCSSDGDCSFGKADRRQDRAERLKERRERLRERKERIEDERRVPPPADEAGEDPDAPTDEEIEDAIAGVGGDE